MFCVFSAAEFAGIVGFLPDNSRYIADDAAMECRVCGWWIPSDPVGIIVFVRAMRCSIIHRKVNILLSIH